jgi:hypothetical protein
MLSRGESNGCGTNHPYINIASIEGINTGSALSKAFSRRHTLGSFRSLCAMRLTEGSHFASRRPAALRFGINMGPTETASGRGRLRTSFPIV